MMMRWILLWRVVGGKGGEGGKEEIEMKVGDERLKRRLHNHSK